VTRAPSSPSAEAIAAHLRPIDLVIFDKDGTLIDFHGMWGAWALRLAEDLERASGRPVAAGLRAVLGVEPDGTVMAHGALAATPMARLRSHTAGLLIDAGISPEESEALLVRTWRSPDPVSLAIPLADLGALFAELHASGRRIAVATSDDRAPTERTLAALGLTEAVDALTCADDGVPVKPAPDAVLEICRRLGVAPARAAVVGDTAADLQMARAAGCGLVIAVTTGAADADSLRPLADLVLAGVAQLAGTAGA
jgi:phosphoglycolate phosphatase